MAVIKAVSSKAGIGQVLDYVTKGEKTEEKLVSGLHCEPETVKDEMQATKELWGKTGGRTYKHFVQSYHADEQITPEQAHRNAVELAEHTQAWQGFEVLIVTHKDRKHIHTHFIVNSVNYEDGHKLQWSSTDLRDLKERCNTQSREQGLHVPEKGKTFEGAEREETVAWKKDTYQLLKQAEQGKVKSYVQEIALAVLDCKETATSREKFIEQIQRADTVVQNCKAEYEQKVRELDRQKNRAERMEQDAKVAMARQQALIRANAEAMSKAERSRLESQYKAKTAGYEGVMLGSLLYGTLCTLFAAARSETFISDFKAFFGVIWSFIRLCADKVFQVAKWAAQVGDMIPQPTVSAIVHWLIQIILVVGVAVGVGFLLFIGGEKLYSGYKEHFADQISLAELLISFAVVVFFAEPIREALPVNLLLLLLICHGACMGIRQYIKGWRRARGYY